MNSERSSRRRFLGIAAGVGAAVGGGRVIIGARSGPDVPGGTDRLVVAYGDHPSQVADLLVPPGDGPHPVLVLVHGGFWRADFDRTLMDPLAGNAVRRGSAVWNIEYRRVGEPGGGWPTTLADVGAAVDHLATLASEHHLDLARVVAAGHSAGGHLALWLATRPGLPDDAPGAAPAVVITAAVSQAGVADLRASEEAGLGGGAAAALLGGSPTAVPDRYDLASPIERLPVGVPTLCVHGGGDPIVPIAQSEAWVAAARAAGDEAELVSFSGGHFEVLDPDHESWQAVVERLS